jgi:hypothetical protein
VHITTVASYDKMPAGPQGGGARNAPDAGPQGHKHQSKKKGNAGRERLSKHLCKKGEISGRPYPMEIPVPDCTNRQRQLETICYFLLPNKRVFYLLLAFSSQEQNFKKHTAVACIQRNRAQPNGGKPIIRRGRPDRPASNWPALLTSPFRRELLQFPQVRWSLQRRGLCIPRPHLPIAKLRSTARRRPYMQASGYACRVAGMDMVLVRCPIGSVAVVLPCPSVWW